MNNLTWSDDYSVHIPAIDNEHRLLISLINDFGLAMDTQEIVQVQIAGETLGRLSRYISRHFESEERFLLFNNYPEFDAHKSEHTQLLERLERFSTRFTLEKRLVNEQMLLFLKDWLVRHIILHDCKFGSYFRGKELAGRFD